MLTNNYGPHINFLPAKKGVVLEIKEQKKFKALLKIVESVQGIEFYKRSGLLKHI